MADREQAFFEHTLLISAAPTRVLAAFTDPVALQAWWQVTRSVTTARVPGVFAVEWVPTADRDDLLGRLGGVFHGTVVEYRPGRELFVADAWWLPPDGDPLGPMALVVRCAMDGPACRLTVTQSGLGEGARWARYREVIGRGWRSSLALLKSRLEEP
ncbi:MAG TPA: SRPBCC domain-containing protein [Vicinamibacterales bacterium]|nr:SRPBCC domain-containing protein [Vicinamibacterales bacterium]